MSSTSRRHQERGSSELDHVALGHPGEPIEVTVFPAITGRAGYAALFQDGPEFDLDLVESTVLDGRTLKLLYVPHLHTGIPEGVGPQRRET
jgi:hypothetical protein